jgi:3-methylcrotonyl-CoA carboxylase alpha subunit
MFKKILIANRGEIACRVMGTARRMGIATVAVYSDADAAAAHVAQADEARRIGPAPAAESYLNIAAIVAAARAAGAQAVHPGYGFLAENADFAEACIAAGLVFVGPPPAAIRALGSKAAAKEIMAKAGVPLVPGYHGADQDPETLAQAAAGTGYPVLIKASAGGGGKGMRVVEKPVEFAAALESARREARASFGDDRVIIEAYLQRPRHIEIQIFADSHGNTLHLFERDCSIQRRHQKVIEEAPAPGLSAARRAEMGAAAVAAAKASGYLGAGTVEFICRGDDFYFMEMNTRLQVEHPVTEMITGQDLVEWQFRVAAGEALPCGQDDLAIRGHAMEARIYAEDPAKDFLPATGKLAYLRFPEPGPHLRIDTGVREGDEVSVHYDPMIAKVTVWGRDRRTAAKRLRAALGAIHILGPANNVAFLAAIAGHDAFIAGEVDTGFIARHHADLLPEAAPASDEVLALASLAELLRRRRDIEAQALRSNDLHSPWFQTSGWRLNAETQVSLTFHDGAREVAVVVRYRPGGFALDLPSGRVEARAELTPDGVLLGELDGHRITGSIVHHDGDIAVLLPGGIHRLRLIDPLGAAAEAEAGPGHLSAPMPGKVIQVHVSPGQTVERGAPLMVLEAMKMEHAISAPADGKIAQVHYAVGDLVEDGAELIAFEAVET